MQMKKISFIIPTVNEEKFIERTIRSIQENEKDCKEKGLDIEVEIIVVANGTTDRTIEIAKSLDVKVIEAAGGIGVSRARNIGAKRASEDSSVLIFLDADSFIGDKVVEGIYEKFTENSYGTVLGRPDVTSFIYSFFFFTKNLVHIMKMYKGALGGLMFFDKKLFTRIGGYARDMSVDEIYEISRRARRHGGKYILVHHRFAYTSMRRFEKYGPINMLGFWLRTRLMNIFKKKVPGASEYQIMED